MKMNGKEKYKFLFDVVLHESRAMWDTSQLFLLSNTILATILGTGFLTDHTPKENKLIPWLLSLIGLSVSILWLFSFRRISKYYNFRMGQIIELEKQLEGLNIFAGIPKEVSDGNKVEIDGKSYSARVFGWNLKSFTIVNIIIWTFIIFFFILAFSTLPWSIKLIRQSFNLRG